MAVHFINPSDNSLGTVVIAPRWLFVLAAATPRSMRKPALADESLEELNAESIQPGDVVGISIHTDKALRGYEVERIARGRGATVVYGGIHATLFPEEPFRQVAADAVIRALQWWHYTNTPTDTKHQAVHRSFELEELD